MFNIEEELKKLPEKSGVYLMKDQDGKVIYVGKAIVLKNRVRQYFQKSASHTPKVLAMVEKIHSFEYIITDTELEALMLECNLIKKHRPHYNILLKDDKTYPYIKITMQETYPRVIMTRKVMEDGAEYFGPYISQMAVRDTLAVLKKLFPTKLCNKEFKKGKEYIPCLYFHIGQCVGPCRGSVASLEYEGMIKDVISFLKGKQEDILKHLQEEMIKASERLEFEKAASIRDKIRSIQIISQKQKMISSEEIDQDIIALSKNRTDACVEIFFVRGGKLIGRENFVLEGRGEDLSGEIIESFLVQFYNKVDFIPPTILIQHEIDNQSLIEEWLSSKVGKRTRILNPKKGEKADMIRMVEKNAEHSLKQFADRAVKHQLSVGRALQRLADITGIQDPIERIEAFDISNTGASEITASMVVFVNGIPDKKQYRRYKIRWTDTQNDYLSIQEVLYRRLKRVEKQEDNHKDNILPQLILVDGGKQHVSSGRQVLQEMKINIPLWGMVKDEHHKTRGLTSLESEFDLKSDIVLLRLITAIQDEAHRFALDYNKLLRSKRYRGSVLDDIPGIGPVKKKKLIKVFGSVKKIKEATLEELTAVEGISKELAQSILSELKD